MPILGRCIRIEKRLKIIKTKESSFGLKNKTINSYIICMMVTIVKMKINLTSKNRVIYYDSWKTLKQFTN